MKKKLTHKALLELHRAIVLPRLIEEKMLILLRQGKISKWFSGIGQEAISVGVTRALKSSDVVFPMHRNLGVFTTREVNLKKLFCQLMGKQGGFTKGRDRSFHFGSLKYNIIGMISHLAAMLPVACGVAYSKKIKKTKDIAVAFVGDGGTSEGDFHESLNLAAVWKLPIIFIIENNGYGLSTPTKEQYACKQLSDRGIGYGIESKTIDGNNLLEVYTTIKESAALCRKNKGPILIEAMTFRIRGHEEASGIDYIPKNLISKWKGKDPILNFEKYLIDNKVISKSEIASIKAKINKSFSSSLEYALKASPQVSNIEAELSDVYKKTKKIAYKKSNKTENKRFVDAISDGLREKMKSDPSVIMMGQDIAEYGGVFKISKGFLDEFGSDRIKNTPIIESGIIGAAMGMALEGFKPIVEMQFADFVSCGFNQIVNNLAKTYYRWNEPINVTIRMPSGGGMGAGPFHSQNNESWFTQIPGLKVVYPSNPADAKGLLISSIDDPNPVLFFEHKGLYRSIKAEVNSSLSSIDIGKGSIVKDGDKLSIISYGLGVQWAIDAIKKLPKNLQASIELIDLRTLVPWDKNLVFNSVKKTGRAMIIHEAAYTSGFGAEIAATLSEQVFEYLDAPIIRLASLDMPTPFSSQIETKVFWPKDNIHNKIVELLNY